MFPNIPIVIGESWTFLRKQPAALSVMGLFLFVPILLLAQIARMEASIPYFQAQSTESSLVLLLLSITLNLITIWGSTCILLIAKRLLQGKAGRTRTSLHAIMTQAAPFFLPYLLTSILRGIIAILWAMLFLIPIVGVLWLSAPFLLAAPSYNDPMTLFTWIIILLLPALAGAASLIRTAFSPVVILNEDIAYRPALRKSSQLVRARFWKIFLELFLLTAMLYIPLLLLSFATQSTVGSGPAALAFLADCIDGIASALVGALYLIGLTILYERERPVSHVSN